MILRRRLITLVPVCASCNNKLLTNPQTYLDKTQTNIAKKICEICYLSQKNENQSKTPTKKQTPTHDIPISRTHIDLFDNKLKTSRSKSQNDKNNKIREYIICALINDEIDASFYEDEKWEILRKQKDDYLTKLNGGHVPYSAKCEQKGGRKYKYDFDIYLCDDPSATPKQYCVEFKFNAKTIHDAPQFVSPSNPSKFLEYNYAEYFYDNYLPILAEKAELPIPPKTEYLEQIHNNAPECMLAFQEKYYRGCEKSSKCSHSPEDAEFYFASKKIADESIRVFISKYNLDIQKLSEYLCSSQNGKIYMLYSRDHGFVMETHNSDEFILLSCEKKGNKYVCVCANGHKLTVLLRWKNGNGIAFPAFQLQVSK